MTPKPASRKGARFKVGQIACIKGMDLPMSAVLITGRESAGVWNVSAEIDGKECSGLTYTTGELRPLTKRERGES